MSLILDWWIVMCGVLTSTTPGWQQNRSRRYDCGICLFPFLFTTPLACCGWWVIQAYLALFLVPNWSQNIFGDLRGQNVRPTMGFAEYSEQQTRRLWPSRSKKHRVASLGCRSMILHRSVHRRSVPFIAHANRAF